MARYRRPPDPRKSGSDDYWEAGGNSDRTREPIPWLWLGLGFIVALLSLALTFFLVTQFLSREPLQVTLPTPTIIRLTAPPMTVPVSSSDFFTPTPIPTFTPPPTPDLSIAPQALTVGYYARVANTDNIGVSLRAGPSTDNLRLLLVPEGEYLMIIGGPEEGNGFIWWQGQLDDGTEGWVAGDFLIPSAQPEDE